MKSFKDYLEILSNKKNDQKISKYSETETSNYLRDIERSNISIKNNGLDNYKNSSTPKKNALVDMYTETNDYKMKLFIGHFIHSKIQEESFFEAAKEAFESGMYNEFECPELFLEEVLKYWEELLL